MDMRKRLGEILDAASAGERILIERDHRPLAYLVSVEDGDRLDPDRDELLAQRIEAMDRLMALGRRCASCIRTPTMGSPPPNGSARITIGAPIGSFEPPRRGTSGQ